MTEWTIDRDSLALFVNARRTVVNDLTMREASDKVGVSASAFARVEGKQTVSAATFLALCLWMEANPFWFLVDPKTGTRLVDPPAVATPEGRST